MTTEPEPSVAPAATVTVEARRATVMPSSPFLRNIVESWQARQELRWRIDPATPTVAPILEQRWTSTLNKDEWRPVPTVSIKAGA